MGPLISNRDPGDENDYRPPITTPDPALIDYGACICEVKGIPGFGPHLSHCPKHPGYSKRVAKPENLHPIYTVKCGEQVRFDNQVWTVRNPTTHGIAITGVSHRTARTVPAMTIVEVL